MARLFGRRRRVHRRYSPCARGASKSIAPRLKIFRIESARPQSGVLFMREQLNRTQTLHDMGISGKSAKNDMTKLDFFGIHRGFTLNSEFEGPKTGFPERYSDLDGPKTASKRHNFLSVRLSVCLGKKSLRRKTFCDFSAKTLGKLP